MRVFGVQGSLRLADHITGDRGRIIVTPGLKSASCGVAVWGDGSTLLISDRTSHTISEFSVTDSSRRRVVGAHAGGSGPLEFNDPRQVWVASDGYVFVADRDNNRVQVLTPRLDFHRFVGVGQLESPAGVCANADVVVVSERDVNRVRIFSRHSGVLVAEFGSEGGGDGQLDGPQGLCFMTGDALVAVADYGNSRVSVFSVHGAFVRHVGVGVLSDCCAVACSAVDELVVADTGNSCVRLFSSSGYLVRTFGNGVITGVAVRGSAIFAQDYELSVCVVFT